MRVFNIEKFRSKEQVSKKKVRFDIYATIVVLLVLLTIFTISYLLVYISITSEKSNYKVIEKLLNQAKK